MKQLFTFVSTAALIACSQPSSDTSPGGLGGADGNGGSTTIVWPVNHTFKLQAGIGVHVWHKGVYLRGAIVMKIVDPMMNTVWIGQPHNGLATYVLRGDTNPSWVEIPDGDEEKVLGTDSSGLGVWKTCHYVAVTPAKEAWFTLTGSAPDLPGTYYLKANDYPRAADVIVTDSNGVASLMLARGEVGQDGGTMGDPDAGPGMGVGYMERVDDVPHATKLENRAIDGDLSCVRGVQ